MRFIRKKMIGRFASTYSPVRVFLHWLSAVVILWASVTGFVASCCAAHSAFRQFFDVFNPQLTTLLIPFFAWRVLLYLRTIPWRGWGGESLQSRLARLVHGLIYGLVTIILVSGVLMMPHPWRVLGVLPMPVLGRWNGALFLLHKGCCMVLVGLIALHLAAVIHHLGRGFLGSAGDFLRKPGFGLRIKVTEIRLHKR